MTEPDYVYYISVNGEIDPWLVFDTESSAIDYAEMHAIKDYVIEEWNVA